MGGFAVWAPVAETVEVVSGARRLPLVRGERGWWSLEVPDAVHGTDYAFSLDGGPALPDPRSPWQPAGVHGPSRVFDPSAHRWSDGGWPGRPVGGKVFYELHAGTFTPEGTLDAALGRLGHLVDLGIDVVELMPVAAFDGHWGWGYDSVGLYAVHEPYGGPAALQRFVDACHVAGLAVCLDMVFNHLGPSGNYWDRFGPYFREDRRTPWGPALNLEGAGSDQVRRWVCDAAAWWLRDFHVDALRLDAVHALVDDSPLHLVAQLSHEVEVLSSRSGRPLSLIAESDLNDPRAVEPVALGGLGATAQWNDDFHHALHALLTGERHGYYVDFGSTEVLGQTLTRVFRHAGEHSTFRGRDWGRPVDVARHSGHGFLGYLQNHDQVGNRPRGDRIGESLPDGLLAAGAALVLTSPFTPLLFMGEEWAAATPWRFFSDFPGPGLAEAVRRGRAADLAGLGWGDAQASDPQDPATRLASVLDWSQTRCPVHGPGAAPGAGPEPAGGGPCRCRQVRMLAWYRDLTALRRARPELRDGDLSRMRVDTGPDWLVMHRGPFLVLVNFSERTAVLPLPGPARPVLAWGGVGLGPDSAVLGPQDVAIVQREDDAPAGAGPPDGEDVADPP
ncbi:MAG: maltooligosyltrehalose trehalohydrolase [Actinomycetota bacterium]|nr:maltooligosyltrehalose trehalohydrolase [Actinomycetota bacterium]